MISVSNAALIVAALSLTGIVIAASVALRSFDEAGEDLAGKAVRPYRAILQTIRLIGFITVLFMGLMVLPLG